jgi:hypothetical protein
MSDIMRGHEDYCQDCELVREPEDDDASQLVGALALFAVGALSGLVLVLIVLAVT